VVYRGKISSFVLPPKKEIADLITGYRGALSTRASALTASQSIKKLSVQSQQIYQKLLEPMADQLKGAGKLIIVPDGVLSYLAFETLVADDNRAVGEPRYLLETFAISYAPSASALFAIQHDKPPASAKGLLAFGDPVYADVVTQNVGLAAGSPAAQFRELPYTRTEVNDLGSLFSDAERHLFLGAAAREQTLKAEPLDRYRYIHLAAHGLIDEDYPARSGIMLSAAGDTREDGVLQMSEVMRLKLNADLVTLSACRSGLGRLVNGEGIIGLTRSFLYAGADGVVVSLWDVNDLSTAALMKSFYVNLKRGLPKDEALRQAKLELLKGKQRSWRHPYFWAPFVLIGAND
jgi:CHAT domain-containing protein